MIPKYPYRVEVTTKTPSGGYDRRAKNFEMLPAAMAYRDRQIGHKQLVNIQVSIVLDETGPHDRPETAGVRS